MSSSSQQPPGSGAATLGRLFERLGATLLSLEAGHLDPGTRVDSVILHDPLDPSVITSGTVVLGVGISGPSEMASQIRALASEGAVALVVREPVPMTPEIGEAVADTGIVLLGLIRGASWIQVATMLTTALAPDGLESGLAGTGSDAAAELFELADAIAALLEAPVTIENLSSRVLAFSANQAGTDEPRRQTILGLQVPEIYGDAQRAQGVFRQVYAAARPVFVNSIEPGTLPRAAMRVKAGEEVLGSIWAVVREPLTEQRAQGMVEASRVVALTMLRARMASDSSVKLRQSLVSMLLEGGLRAREAASQLTISSAAACVLALAPESSTDVNEARSESELQRVTSALNMYLQPISPRAVAALLGGIIYAVVPFHAAGADSEGRALQLATEFVGRMKTQGKFSVGVGRIVSNVSELAQSRSDADGALRVLRSRSTGGARVATVDSVQVEWLMLRISDSLAADGVAASGPISVLRSYDLGHGTEFVATLRTWLDHLGDVRAAALSLHVHVNTFRYRLRRLKEIADVDLSNADTRFGLMLQLRLLP